MKFVLCVLKEMTTASTALLGQHLNAECFLNFILLIHAESTYMVKSQVFLLQRYFM